MNSTSRRQQGFAIVVVLLVTMIALGAAVTSATVAALSSRQVASSERRSTVALFAAESGLNTVLARSRTPQFAYDDDVHDSVQDWLTTVGLDSYALPGGSRVAIDAIGEGGGMVTLRAVGTAPDGSQRTIYQDFGLDSTAIAPGLFADAALLTKEALKTNSAKSRLLGRGLAADEWMFDGRLLLEAREDEYVQIDNVTYRVENRESDGSAELVLLGEESGDREPGSTPVTLIPFAIVSVEGTSSTATLTVTDASLYEPGTIVEIGDGAAEILDRREGEIDVRWVFDADGDGVADAGAPAPSNLAEGLPIRKRVPSAIAEGGCPSGDMDDKLPHGCIEEELGDLFANTFTGLSKTELRDLAIEEGAYYKDGAWPSEVVGLTWIDGAKTQGKNNALCGEGVVVLNTGSSLEDNDTRRINLTTADCEFEGVLYVIGQLKLVGNLDNLTGAVITEGPGVTEVQGNGDKSMYDPLAVRRAMEHLPPITVDNGLYAILPNSLRFGR